MSNRAWVTLATNDSYGLGALVLAHSLRRINSVYPAVILVTPSVTEAMRNRLSAVFAEVITVDVLDSRDATHLALLQRPELGITFTKIHCWSLTQYEKCVFLDADTLVVQNCDELFEREELSAAPDVGWPDCFNSGVFVFVPSPDTYTRLIAFAQERGSFDGGDQGLLNAFFSDWAHGDINKHLPFLYNVTSAAFYSYLPALKHYGQNLKIIHFIGAMKPWLQRFNWESRSVDAPDHIRELLQQWWDIFVGQVHPNLDSTMEPTETNVENSEEKAPPEVPPQDLQYHYEAKVDPQSEFPWHHPETHVTKQNKEQQTVDMSRFYDPWANYKFPASKNHSTIQYQNENITWIDQRQNQIQFQEPRHQYHHHSEQTLQQYDHNKQENENNEGQSQQIWSQNYQEHHNKDKKTDFQNHQRYQEQPQYYLSQNDHEHNHEHTKTVYQYHQHERSTHSQRDYQIQNHTIYQDPAHSQIHGQQNEEYNLKDRHCATQNGYSKEHTYEQHPVYINRPRDEKSYHLHWDTKRRDRRPRRKMDRIKTINEEQLVTNGHISDTDSDHEDDFRPRHPYDGFYLRHRATIDSRGRKVCTHEIPPTPLPSPPPEDVPDTQAGSLPIPGEDEEYLTASECEDQSGVAGNLARVVPGIAGSQCEAVDELTRRQGWEAGNIDYMGADSFTNIWAKISQTLNQPPAKQPSPPRKEPSPPKQPSPPKEQPQVELPKPSEVQETAPLIESKSVVSISPVETAAPVVTPSAPEAAQSSVPIQTEAAKLVEEAAKVESVPAVASVPEAQKEKTVPTVPPTPPETQASTPVTEIAPKLDVSSAEQLSTKAESPKVIEVPKASEDPQAAQASKVAEPAQTAETPKAAEQPRQIETPKVAEAPQVLAAAAPASPETSTPAASIAATAETTPVKLDSSVVTTTSTDSPPLANTPSKEDAPTSPAAKSEERRKPVEKLQLSPPAVADPLPTPDSEAEDAATLAQSIIASELKVTSPSPSAELKSPQLLQEDKKLNVQKPELPTPPVSLAQIGVKPKAKPTTAALIESSVLGKSEAPTPDAQGTPTSPTTPTTPSEPSTPTETPGKKKVVKKVVKKEGGPGEEASTPVPPPRKKEKKPKDK